MADGTFALMQLAQANASGEAIGQVASFSGDVFIVRTDGTEVKGGQGTEIYQGDVVRTSGDGEVGLVFADDTTFSLGEDGEMTIDEMVYDPGAESGSAAFSVAKGVFGFVSGQLAKVDPDAMVIDTPVATIGIRGSSGTGRAAPEGEESTFILVPDPDGTIGEIIIHTETGSVVMNVPYQASAVLSAFISPSAPVALPASVVTRVFGNTVEALSAARANAGVQDDPVAAAADDEAPSGADAPEAGAAEFAADQETGTGDNEALDAAVAASAAEQAALEAAAASPDAEAEAAAAEAFDEAIAGGGSLVDAFRAAVDASEQKGAEVARQAEEEEAESAELLGESIDRGLDDLLSQSRAAQEQGRSAAEAEEREQAGEQAQAAVEAGLTQDLNELAEAQARAQLESGFSRVLTAEELAEIRAEKAAAKAAAAAAAEAAAKAAAAAAAANTGGGNNVIIGGAGDDVLTGGADADTINGGGGDDTITGAAGADNLDGAGGDDTFIYRAGHGAPGETVQGNTGTDTVEVHGRNVDLTGVSFQNVEHLQMVGSSEVILTEDQFGDNSNPSVFTGGIRFEAGAGQNVIIMSSGRFTNWDLNSVLPANLMNYDTALHTLDIRADASDTRSFRFTGNDGANKFTGGAGDDTFTGGAGGETLTGNAGDDVFNGGGGVDLMFGGAGDDTFYFDAGDVTAGEAVIAGDGTDRIFINRGQDVDFTGAAAILEVETLHFDGGAGSGATFTAQQFNGFDTVNFGGTGAVTVNIQLGGETSLDLSSAGVTYAGAGTPGAQLTYKITGGTAAQETITGSVWKDHITASMGGDLIDLGSDRVEDKIKIGSWDEFAMTVSNFGGASDKITFNGLTLTDNAGNTDSAVDFEAIANANARALNLKHASHSDNSVFQFTHNSMYMGSGTDASNAADRAFAIIGQGGTKALTVHADAENIFILYNGVGRGAAVFYFENANNDRNVDRAELKLLAYIDSVAVNGLSESNFEFATDPLVFDLDGDGVTLTAAPVSFDTDGDGQNDATTWFDADDAMLVIDENADGVINSMKEVVSSFLSYGGGKAAGKSSLDALAQFDDNADGVIDSADAVFSVLKLWKDADGDGVTDAGELLTLADYGITRIGLNGETVNEETSGGTVHRTAEAEKANGDKITVAEVSFDSVEDNSDPTAGTSAA